MSPPKTGRRTRAQQTSKRLADDVPPSVRADGELIPGLKPASIANPGRHPSREVERRRRSGLTVPALVDPADQPDDTAGRVTFLFGETLVDADGESPPALPADNDPADPKAEPVGWIPVAVVAAALVVVFVLGIELLK